MALRNSIHFPAACGALLCITLLWLAIPAAQTAWKNAAAGLDHTRAVTPYETTLIALSSPALTSQQRESMVAELKKQNAAAPGETHNWFLLAAALEPIVFTPANAALFDQALSMSLLTGPYARDLTAARAALITRHWHNLSPELQNLWQEQTLTLWGSAPERIRASYQSLPPDGQKIMLETLGEAP